MSQIPRAGYTPADIPEMEHTHRLLWEISITSAFATLATVISFWSILGHLRNFTAPRFQLHICRILLMVPVYALVSLFSTLAPDAELPLVTTRDSYEAYVIYSFFSLLTAYLGGEDCLVDWLEVRGRIKHPWPFRRICKPIKLGGSFYVLMKKGILQFVFVKPILAIIVIILSVSGLYKEGSYSLSNGFIYVNAINSISVSISLYCLVLFYIATEEKLMRFKPLPKFICVKSVVFFSYWQSCLFQLLVATHVVKTHNHAIIEQNMVLCIEMMIAAVAHHFAFSTNEYKDIDATCDPLLPSIMKVLDVHDVLGDAEVFLTKQKRQEELVQLVTANNDL